MEKQLKDEILKALANFTGTEQIWEHRTIAGKLYLTDGCNFLRVKTQSRWLFDLIFSYQVKLKGQDFQCWTLKKKKGNVYIVVCHDGNEKELVKQQIPYSDFPLDEIKIWLIDNVCILPSEY